MKNGKTQKSIGRRKREKAKLGLIALCMVIAVGLAVAFPFIIDCMYGRGILGAIYNNSFSAEVWFSFIGSYFPATIIGMITLYQAYIIQCKERKYEKLLARHRFVPDDPAHVYRYNIDKNRIGSYTVSKLEALLGRGGRLELFNEWKDGYILECNIHDSSRMEIDCVDLKEIDWEINGEKVVQVNPEKMICVIDRNTWEQYRLTMFCIFDEPVAANIQINQCMVSAVRSDYDYMNSRIVVSLQIIDDDEENYDLKLWLKFQSQDEVHEMKSVTEKFLCEVSNG